jgi:hypothetical protein
MDAVATQPSVTGAAWDEELHAVELQELNEADFDLEVRLVRFGQVLVHPKAELWDALESSKHRFTSRYFA